MRSLSVSEISSWPKTGPVTSESVFGKESAAYEGCGKLSSGTVDTGKVAAYSHPDDGMDEQSLPLTVCLNRAAQSRIQHLLNSGVLGVIRKLLAFWRRTRGDQATGYLN